MEKTVKGVGAAIGSVASTTLLAAASWIVYSRLKIRHDLDLPPALNAEREQFGGGYAGMLSYYADRSGAGTPLLLLHSINAAASAYEVKPLFERFRGERPVFALELPGFGFSQRGERPYAPRVYTNAIIGFLETQVEGPVDIVALSLSGEFAARAALERASQVRSLALISPTGLSARPPQQPNEGIFSAVSFPLWSQALFDLLTTRLSIRQFLGMSLTGKPDEGMVDYSYTTAHQPGARFAPLAFISGKLHSPDIRAAVYEQLTQPALVLYDQDPYTSFEALPDLLDRHDTWQARRIVPTRGLPHFDQPEQTFEALAAFWSGLEGEGKQRTA